MLKNKKAMIANMIGGFVTILIAVSLIGPIAQELENATNCGLSNTSSLFSQPEQTTTVEDPNGATGSFGGGGAAQFGGYDGQVKHKSFTQTIASTSMYKTDKSVLNPDCVPLTGAQAEILKMAPVFFALAIVMMGIVVAFNGLRNSGLIGSEL